MAGSNSLKYSLVEAHLHSQELEINVQWGIDEVNVLSSVDGGNAVNTGNFIFDGGDAEETPQEVLDGGNAEVSIYVD